MEIWLIALVVFAAIVAALSGVARWLGASRFLAFAIPVFPLVVWLIYCLGTGAAAVGHGVFPYWILAVILLVVAVPVGAITVCIVPKRDDVPSA